MLTVSAPRERNHRLSTQSEASEHRTPVRIVYNGAREAFRNAGTTFCAYLTSSESPKSSTLPKSFADQAVIAIVTPLMAAIALVRE
jgi:hypothetical protein